MTQGFSINLVRPAGSSIAKDAVIVWDSPRTLSRPIGQTVGHLELAAMPCMQMERIDDMDSIAHR